MTRITWFWICAVLVTATAIGIVYWSYRQSMNGVETGISSVAVILLEGVILRVLASVFKINKSVKKAGEGSEEKK